MGKGVHERGRVSRRPEAGKEAPAGLGAASGAPATLGTVKGVPGLATSAELAAFTELVWREGKKLYRDLPWRDTREAYAVLLSEVMLQQTQVARVLGRWESWLADFPTPEALASAPVQLVLERWQGMGYNRRALNLHRAAREICERFGGQVPRGKDELLSLPGIGPATAAGVRVFAYGEPDVYVETNVRAVFIHEFFDGTAEVADRDIAALTNACCPADESCRAWYYALLDYGAHLKASGVNPARRAKAYRRQSRFEGSHRQKRAFLLRCVLEGEGTTEGLAADLNAVEEGAGRPALGTDEVLSILGELAAEGFIVRLADGSWAGAE